MKARAGQVTVNPSGLAIVTGTDVQAALADLDAAVAAGEAGYTDEQVRDVIAAALVAGSGVTITPDDTANTITLAATGGGGGGTPVAVNLLRMLAYTISGGSWSANWTDGSTGYLNYADAGTGVQTRTIDLGTSVPITNFEWTFFWDGARVYSAVTVDVSNDGSTWTNKRASGNYTADAAPLVVTINGTWRYVRLSSNGSNLYPNNEWVEIAVKSTVNLG